MKVRDCLGSGMNHYAFVSIVDNAIAILSLQNIQSIPEIERYADG